MRQLNHKKRMAGSTLLYVLLALAVIGLIFSWVVIKSRDESIAQRNAQIAELENLNDSKNADNAKLTQQLATSEQNNADLTALQLETKRQLSFSRAANQRAEFVSTARSNLMGTASDLRSQVADLSTQNEQIAPLKRSLSFANASNKRLTHVSEARDNLISQVNAELATNAALSKQAATIPGLKSRLSYANAANKRLTHVSEARDNLITQVKAELATNAALSEQAATIPGLKSRLSYANAANRRLEHIKEAHGNLMVKNQALQTEADRVPGLVQNLDAANGENARLRVIEDASRIFIDSINGSVAPALAPTSAATTESNNVVGEAQSEATSEDAIALAANMAKLAEIEKKRSYASAEAQRARQKLKALPKLAASIDALNDENDALKQDNAAIPVLKKELSFARAQNKRLQHTANARDNLIGQIQDAKSTISDLEESEAQQRQAAADVEKARSLASADAQRAKAKASNLPRLAVSINTLKQESINTLKQENEQLVEETKAASVVKKELSYARANISRLEYVSKARDNLMGQLKDAKSSIAILEDTSASASEQAAAAEKQRSFAAAEAQRAQAKAANIPRLATTIGDLKAENEQLAEQTSNIPALKKDLSMARAEVQRLDAVKKARANLMGQLKAVAIRDEEAQNAAQADPEATTEVVVDAETESTEQTVAEADETASSGGSELQQMLDELKPELQKNIVFASGSAWVNFKARKSLNKVAALMETYSDDNLLVAGHTDTVGKSAVNKVLSQTRAERVVEYLVSRNIDESRLTAIGYGAEKPLNESGTEEAQLINRRVEFKVEN